MTIPQPEFVDCNYNEMMKHFKAHASNILPNRTRVAYPERATVETARNGKTIISRQEIVYLNGNGNASGWIVRLTFDDRSTFDYPILLDVDGTVYVLTDYSFI